MAAPNNEQADGAPLESGPLVSENARSRVRYSIVADLEYNVMRLGRVVRKGRGKTVNLSSGGLLFHSDAALPQDSRITISIAWPVNLAPRIGLTLHIIGRIVRAQGDLTAVRNEKHEFRVRAIQPESCGLSASAGAASQAS